jgi:hypothetical protein
MSFLKSLFGGGTSNYPAGTSAPTKSAEHKGFTIEARPFKEGGQYQLCGVIAKTVDGVRKEHRFVRADRFSGQDEAADITLNKGRQIVDERGEKVFE